MLEGKHRRWHKDRDQPVHRAWALHIGFDFFD